MNRSYGEPPGGHISSVRLEEKAPMNRSDREATYGRHGSGHCIAKLRSRRGESLVEVLVSVLVGVLAVGLLASAIAASSQIDRSAEQKDEGFYEELSAAEAQESSTELGEVTVTLSDGTSIQFDVDYYGGDDIRSYKLKGGTS